MQVIFRYALALFKYKEDDILKIRDCDDIYQYLRFFPKTIIDGRSGILKFIINISISYL